MRALGLALLIALAAMPAWADCTNMMRRDVLMYPGFKTFPAPETAPDLTFTRPDGAAGRLSDLRGKPSLVSFWFPRCPGCRQEGPSLNAMLDTRKPQAEVNFLSLSVQGTGAEVGAYLARNGYASMEANLDTDAALFRELCLSATPVHVVLNADAQMLAVLVGPQDWTGENATLLLDTLVATGGI